MPLILQNTPGEWDGTFFETARALLLDLLDEGPIAVIVTDENDEVITGQLAQFGAATNRLFFMDGREADLDGIHRIEVP